MPKDLTEYAKQNDIQLLSHNDARGKGRSVIHNAVHGDMELSFLEHESLVSLFLYKMKCRAKTYTSKVLNFSSMKDNFVMDIRKNGKIAHSQKYMYSVCV